MANRHIQKNASLDPPSIPLQNAAICPFFVSKTGGLSSSNGAGGLRLGDLGRLAGAARRGPFPAGHGEDFSGKNAMGK